MIVRQRGQDVIFNGFISYSHAADDRLAPAVQRGLHRLAKPWHRRRALWIFRDQTGLAVTPALWSSIQAALDGSDYFVLLASPEAARSPWVNREIEHWVATKSASRILPVVTDGHWEWDPVRRDFTDDSTALPAALRGVFAEEPLFLDLRWARDDLQLSLRHSRFRDAIAQLAAPMHGVSKDDLEGEDVRQHRRARQLRSGALTTVVVLALVAALTGVWAVRNAGRADTAAAEALRQQRSASQQREAAEHFAGEARHQQELAGQQQARARAAAQETRRQEQLARQQRAFAEQAATEAGRQKQLARAQKDLAERMSAEAMRQQQHARGMQELADRTAVRARVQERLAQQQYALAQQWAAEASVQEQAAQQQRQVAGEQERLAQKAALDADHQRRSAAQQRTVAIGRRLMNQARSMIDDDPRTALMLGAAAGTIQADAEARRELAGLVTSTRYAGTLGRMKEVAFGAGDVLAGTGDDGTVSLWNVADRANPIKLATLEGSGWSSKPAFHPNGRVLAVVDASGAATLWDVTDPRRPVRKGRVAEPANVSAMAFSPDGRTLAMSGWSLATDTAPHTDVVALWDVADPARPAPLSTAVPDHPVDGFAFGPGGRTVVMTGDVLEVWNVTDRAHPVRLTTLDDAGRLAAFSPAGPLLATATGGAVVLWDLTDPAQPERRGALTVGEEIGVMSFAPDGQTLAIGGGENVTLLTTADPWSPTKLGGMSGNAGAVTGLVYSRDRPTLATLGEGMVTLWNTADYGVPRVVADLRGVQGTALATTFGPDGRSMATAHEDGTAIFWDVSRPDRPVRRAVLPVHGDDVRAAAFSRDRRTVAAVGYDARLTLTDTTDPSRPRTLATVDLDGFRPRPREFVKAVTFSPDGRTLAVGGSYGTMMVWDLSNRSRPRLLVTKDHGQGLNSVVIGPDGRTLAVTFATGEVELWGLANRSVPVRLASLAGRPFSSVVPLSAAFSPDGRVLVTRGQTETTALLWDISDRARPQRLATLTGYTGHVLSAHFSPDRRTLATGGGDGTVVVWDVVDRARPLRLATLHARTSYAATVVLSGDGRTLATGSTPPNNLIVTLWDYTSSNGLRADPARRACAVTGRGLNAGEWARHIPEVPYRATCGG